MRRETLALAGAAILAVFSIAALPFERGLFRAPATPYDRGGANLAASAFLVLRRAEALVPPGSPILVRSEPSNPTNDTYLHRYAVALLPRRRIIPAARWGMPSESVLVGEAQYVIVVGPPPADPPGLLLLELPEGTVWRRS